MKAHEDFVRMSKSQCPVCGEMHDRDAQILIHKSLKEIPEEEAIAPPSLCHKHYALHKDGYVAIVIVSNEGAESPTLKDHEALRTGSYMHIKRKVAQDIFNADIGDMEYIFGDEDLFGYLKVLAPTPEE